MALAVFATLLALLFTSWPTSTSQLRKDAEDAATLVAERRLCGIAAPYRGLDAVFGRYDVNGSTAEQFQAAFDRRLKRETARFGEMDVEAQKLYCSKNITAE